MSYFNLGQCDEDKIIRSLIDPKDLDAEYKNHLTSCIKCVEEGDKLRHELSNIGALARVNCPIQHRTFMISSKVKQGLFIVHPAILALSLFIFAVIWMPSPAQIYKVYTDSIIIEQALSDKSIVKVIRDINEQMYTDIKVDFSENSDSYVNDDFMRFIVPVSIQEDSSGQVNDPVKKY